MSVIAERFAQVDLAAPVQHLNLTLYPLLADGPARPEYRLLDEALAAGMVRVMEVSASGHVPELSLLNEGDQSVLLLDGEELIGAKQNRILNLSVLAPAHQTLVIPVSCVEAGRWHSNSREFSSSGRAHFAAGRARKSRDVSESLRRRGSRESNQGEVWRDIAQRADRLGVSSPTRAAAAMYEDYRPRLDEFQAAFAPQAGQCGALFAINGRLVGVDLFDSPHTLAAVLRKLVESYALDAIDAREMDQTTPPEEPGPWLAAIVRAQIATFPAVGEGEDWRLHDPGVTGGALVKDGRLIHLCAFRVAHQDERPGSTRIHRSFRGRRHTGNPD